MLAVIALVSTVEYLALGAPEGLGTLLPPLVALFAVGRHAPPRDLVVAAPLAVLTIAVHELRDPGFRLDGSEIVLWAVLAAAWPIGAALRRGDERARQAHASRSALTEEAVNAERARIARDLHDVVGHAVGVVVLQAVAGTAQLQKERYTDVQQRLSAIEGTARDALAEMRRLVDVIDGRASDEVIASATTQSLPLLVDRLRSSGLDARLELSGPHRELPAGLELAAYRLVQEALTNAVRHAQGASVVVAVDYRPDALEIRVSDTGSGYHGGAATHGRGLLGMRERVALYGGQLQAGPDLDGGFTVRALLPVPQAAT